MIKMVSWSNSLKGYIKISNVKTAIFVLKLYRYNKTNKIVLKIILFQS